ncbi:MAG: protein-L-isoaspartate(D-aspartate) O-methyltransferase [Candidatus Eisenbacteria bacterium]
MNPYRGVGAYRSSRERMVKREAEERGIKDRAVLRSMREVPRHLFADDALAGQAYSGHALPIGFGQTLTQPYMVARMTEALEVEGGKRVLEIGTGSGYQAAVLARLGCAVFTIERIPELARRARRVLDEIGASNVLVRAGDGSRGWSEYAPYERILVTAGAGEIPATLLGQLADPGILVTPLGEEEQDLVVVRRENGRDRTESLGPCRFVPLLPGTAQPGGNGTERKGGNHE